MTDTPKKRGRKSFWPPEFGLGAKPNPIMPQPVWDILDEDGVRRVLVKMVKYPAFKDLTIELADKYEEP